MSAMPDAEEVEVVTHNVPATLRVLLGTGRSGRLGEIGVRAGVKVVAGAEGPILK